jgi:DnaD/phage-associated family protein
MMKGFGGFPPRGKLIKLPGLFFSELLPQIDDLAEMKVTLYCFWRLGHKDGPAAYVWEQEISADGVFMGGLGASESEQLDALRSGLERAAARGTLIRAEALLKGKAEALYFINTDRGRAMAQGLAEGKWQPDDKPNVLIDLRVERPTIFSLYEQNIGPLTPMISENLRDFETTYPAGWLEEAIGIAVARNKRSLAYIEGILKRWQTEGRAGDDQPRDGSRFLSGKYRDEINY